MTEAERQLLRALDATVEFLKAVDQPEREQAADSHLDALCLAEGPENAASMLSALASLITLMWAESSGDDVEVLTDRVRARLRGDGGSASGAHVPRKPAPSGDGKSESARP